MFNKANQKGMAIILYFIMTTIDPEFKAKYAVCWFPYTLAEMKEFKTVTLQLFAELQEWKVVPNHACLNWSVIETASGVWVWEMLKFLSDYALRWKLSELHGGWIPDAPDFLMSVHEFKKENVSGGAPDDNVFVKDMPAIANLCP